MRHTPRTHHAVAVIKAPNLLKDGLHEIVLRFFVNRHLGKFSHPKNFDPALGPFFAILSTSLDPQLGQTVVELCRSRKDRT